MRSTFFFCRNEAGWDQSPSSSQFCSSWRHVSHKTSSALDVSYYGTAECSLEFSHQAGVNNWILRFFVTCRNSLWCKCWLVLHLNRQTCAGVCTDCDVALSSHHAAVTRFHLCNNCICSNAFDMIRNRLKWALELFLYLPRSTR